MSGTLINTQELENEVIVYKIIDMMVLCGRKKKEVVENVGGLNTSECQWFNSQSYRMNVNAHVTQGNEA